MFNFPYTKDKLFNICFPEGSLVIYGCILKGDRYLYDLINEGDRYLITTQDAYCESQGWFFIEKQDDIYNMIRVMLHQIVYVNQVDLDTNLYNLKILPNLSYEYPSFSEPDEYNNITKSKVGELIEDIPGLIYYNDLLDSSKEYKQSFINEYLLTNPNLNTNEK